MWLHMLQPVEGIVTDVGWYRTCIRSFEREMYTIPNSVFSRNVVLNITRKNKEWRFFEFFGATSIACLAKQQSRGVLDDDAEASAEPRAALLSMQCEGCTT